MLWPSAELICVCSTVTQSLFFSYIKLYHNIYDIKQLIQERSVAYSLYKSQFEIQINK